MIDGVYNPSMRKVAQTFNMNTDTVKSHCHSQNPRWKDWTFCDQKMSMDGGHSIYRYYPTKVSIDN